MAKMELLLWQRRWKLRWMDAGIQDVEIWRANPAEADSAFGLVEEYFEAIGVVLREDRGEFVREYFGDRQGFWVARAGGELAGCVALRKLMCLEESRYREMRCAEIKRMYVREKFRGRGIAQRLLEAAEQFARGVGYAWIYLDTTNEMVSAARLYERNGFVRCERYNENPQAAIFMRKRLLNNYRDAERDHGAAG
jgi:GNAT superfamily N-acetyltransferase